MYVFEGARWQKLTIQTKDKFNQFMHRFSVLHTNSFPLNVFKNYVRGGVTHYFNMIPTIDVFYDIFKINGN